MTNGKESNPGLKSFPNNQLCTLGVLGGDLLVADQIQDQTRTASALEIIVDYIEHCFDKEFRDLFQSMVKQGTVAGAIEKLTRKIRLAFTAKAYAYYR